jgi:hypothetical protein
VTPESKESEVNAIAKATTTQGRPPRQRKPLTPATGTFSWVIRPTSVAGWGILRIKNHRSLAQYLVQPVFSTIGDLLGFTMSKQDGTRYCLELLPTGHYRCDCADGEYRRVDAPTAELAQCKHAAALRSALAENHVHECKEAGHPYAKRTPGKPLVETVRDDADLPTLGSYDDL